MPGSESRNAQATPESNALANSDGAQTESSPYSDTSDKFQTTRLHSRKFLLVMAMQNIITLKQGLSKQAAYWSGLSSVQRKFDERLAQAQATNKILASLAKTVSTPRSGLSEKQAIKRKRKTVHADRGSPLALNGTMGFNNHLTAPMLAQSHTGATPPFFLQDQMLAFDGGHNDFGKWRKPHWFGIYLMASRRILGVTVLAGARGEWGDVTIDIIHESCGVATMLYVRQMN